MSTPTFSVVIPAYEAAAVVGGALASVAEQTVAPLETIVVDDGSTDDIAGAVAAAGIGRLIRIAHGGEAVARNAGVAAAKGVFVAFLDADDAYEPGFIEAVGRLAEERADLDVLTTDSIFETPAGPRGTFYTANRFPAEDQRRAIVRSCFLTTLSAVRADRVRAAGGFDPSLTHGTDWDLWIRLILTGSEVGLMPEPLSRYRLHPGQATARRAASLRGRVAVLEKTLRSGLLHDDERRLVEGLLPAARARAAVATAAQGGLRRHWRAVALDGRLPARTRLLGLAGALAPPVAARRTRIVAADGQG